MIELMGAQPVTVQAADLTQALATGVVAANITSSSTGYDTKSWGAALHASSMSTGLAARRTWCSCL